MPMRRMRQTGIGPASAQPMTTVEDLLGNPAFKSASLGALDPKARLPWLARMSNGAPVRTLVFDGIESQIASPREPHDCAQDNALVLYAATSGKICAHIDESGRVTPIGAPGAAPSAELGKMCRRAFRK